MIESFRPFVDIQNKRHVDNIESNWKIISGGLQNHKRGDFVNLYGLIHMIRQIDDYSFFPITQQVYDICTRQKIEIPKVILKDKVAFRLDKSSRQKINRLLNQMGTINDSIQIEHLNGGVKSIAQKLINSDCKNWKSLQKIHFENTLCCCKLHKAESEINHRTDLSRIKII